MKILIFGAGAVGLGLAGCIIKAGHHPDIIAREDTVIRLDQDGLIRSGILGADRFSSFNAFSDIKYIKDRAPYDYILVCTKSNDSLSAARAISRFPEIFSSKTCIVLCQNGWGNREIFLQHFPSPGIYNARIITGFSRPEKYHVKITVHVQPVHLGSLDHSDCKELESLCSAINQGGLTCELTETIEKDLWAKMLFNCSLNPLGAIFDVPYGKLGESENCRKIMKEIIHEVFQVMEKAGYSTHWESSNEYFSFLIHRLIPDAARHESSTLQDIRAKKKTEINALTGAVVKLGDEHRVHTPTNLMLYQMIRFMEEQYMTG